jgi:phage baseplate assembly protein W
MLPETEDLQSDELVEETVYPNDTYILDFENKIIRRISDDDEQTLQQAIMKILLTESDEYSIYDDYGREFGDLLGENTAQVMETIGSRIEDAILKDDRFNAVEIADIKANRGNVIVSITVTTSDDEEIQMEGVELDV